MKVDKALGFPVVGFEPESAGHSTMQVLDPKTALSIHTNTLCGNLYGLVFLQFD